MREAKNINIHSIFVSSPFESNMLAFVLCHSTLSRPSSDVPLIIIG